MLLDHDTSVLCSCNETGSLLGRVRSFVSRLPTSLGSASVLL